jgi:hypothetical protein
MTMGASGPLNGIGQLHRPPGNRQRGGPHPRAELCALLPSRSIRASASCVSRNHARPWIAALSDHQASPATPPAGDAHPQLDVHVRAIISPLRLRMRNLSASSSTNRWRRSSRQPSWCEALLHRAMAPMESVRSIPPEPASKMKLQGFVRQICTRWSTNRAPFRI